MARISIYVPNKLKAMMAKHDLNWSHHARNAFIMQMAIDRANLARDKAAMFVHRQAMWQMDRIREELE